MKTIAKVLPLVAIILGVLLLASCDNNKKGSLNNIASFSQIQGTYESEVDIGNIDPYPEHYFTITPINATTANMTYSNECQFPVATLKMTLGDNNFVHIELKEDGRQGFVPLESFDYKLTISDDINGKELSFSGLNFYINGEKQNSEFPSWVDPLYGSVKTTYYCASHHR